MVGGLGRCVAQAEENPGKVVVPVGGSSVSTKGILEAAMEPLHHAIRLGVIGSGGVMCDVEEGAKMGPQSRGELRASVGGDMRRNTMASNPVMYQGRSAVCGGGRRQGDSIRPAGSPVQGAETRGRLFGV